MDFEQFSQSIENLLQSLGVSMTTEELLVCLGVGAVAGWIASQVVGGKGGIFRYLTAGIIGSFLGPAILSFLGLSLPELGMSFVNEVIMATVGAIAVVLVARVVG